MTICVVKACARDYRRAPPRECLEEMKSLMPLRSQKWIQHLCAHLRLLWFKPVNERR